MKLTGVEEKNKRLENIVKDETVISITHAVITLLVVKGLWRLREVCEIKIISFFYHEISSTGIKKKTQHRR